MSSSRIQGGGNVLKAKKGDQAPAPVPVPAPVPADPAQTGPWFATNSPWRTPIPSDWQNYVHPDTPSMMQGSYTELTNLHAWAYYDTNWFGPRVDEFFCYPPAGTPTVPVFQTFNSVTVNVPIPSGFMADMPVSRTDSVNGSSWSESRCVIWAADGSMWGLYQVTPAGWNGNSSWSCTIAVNIPGGWTGSNPLWHSGGTKLPQGPGVLTPRDFIDTPVGGHFDHVIAADWTSGSTGAVHPKYVWPNTDAQEVNSDGRVASIVGIPSSARIFLDPSLTEADFTSLGVTKEWQKQILRTCQVYGVMCKESSIGQAGCRIICESPNTVAFNASKGVAHYPSGYQYPWVVDGSGWQYDNSVPASLFPQTGSRWKVFDWNKSYPGITVAA